MDLPLEQEAERYIAQRNFKECGRSYLSLAEQNPTCTSHPIWLWNAGECFERAHLIGQALKARLQLIGDHPKHRLAKRALERVSRRPGGGLPRSWSGSSLKAIAEQFSKEPDEVTGLAAIHRYASDRYSEPLNALEIKPEAQYEPTTSMSLANVLEPPEQVFEKAKPATD